MRSLCSCFNPRDPEEDVSSAHQNCICPSCIFNKLFRKYEAVCNKQQGAPTLNTEHVEASFRSDAVSNNAESNNIVASAPRIMLITDADATASNSTRKVDGRLRYDQESDQVHKKHDSKGNKSSGLQCQLSMSQLKLSSDKSKAEVALISDLLEEDQDVCPICLEEYIPENPKIVLQCSHGYHLSCIYEWMERSTNCPICDKVMIFDDAT